MQVNYHFHNEHYVGSVFISHPISSEKIIAAFPYELPGETHFRVRVNAQELFGSSTSQVDYLWLDLPFSERSTNGLVLDEILGKDSLSIDIQVRWYGHHGEDEPVLYWEEDVVIEEANGSISKLPPVPVVEERQPRSEHMPVLPPNPTVPAAPFANPSSSTLGSGSPGKHSGFHLPKFLRKTPSSSSHSSNSVEVDPSAGHSSHQTANSSSSSGSSANATTAQVSQTVKKGATSLWKAVVSTAEKLQQSINTIKLDDGIALGDQEDNPGNVMIIHDHLSTLATLLATPYHDDNADHVHLITQLLYVQCPQHANEGTALDNSLWKAIGWQGTHPKTDLKSSGLLALQSMLYFHQHYAKQSMAMVARNTANTKTTYPFAIVGVNLTLLLADLFQLRDHNYRKITAGFQSIFMQDTAFYEIFCLSFAHVDFLWQQKQAIRSQFGQIINEMKVLLTKILQRQPRSMDEFHFVAIDEGMARLNN